MRLEIDLGNSFLKWRLISDGLVVERGRAQLGGAEVEWSRLRAARVRSIWVASVASGDKNRHLANQLVRWFNLQPEFARTSREAAGLRCGYLQPEKMGVDRWLAMLGAWRRESHAFLVVDAGTAITIDRVAADGAHLGGHIIPGYRMMQSALLGNTDRVRFEPASEAQLQGGLDTGACVAAGASLAMAGIAAQIAWLASQAQESQAIYLTGGDADRLEPHLAALPRVEMQPDLVFDGLELAERVGL